MRLIATFTPQAWINKNAIEVDPLGETTWDVTEHLKGLSREDRLAATETDSYASDALRDLDDAPEWASNWGGPFYVRVHAEPESDQDRAQLLLGGDSPCDVLDWQLDAGDATPYLFRNTHTGERFRVSPGPGPGWHVLSNEHELTA